MSNIVSARTAPVDLSDAISQVQVMLLRRGWANRYRAARQTPNGLQFTGAVRWEITNSRSLWRCLWCAAGEARARELGEMIRPLEPHRRLYCLLAALEPAEVQALAHYMTFTPSES